MPKFPFLFLVALSACSASAFNSSVPASKALSDLSDEEYCTLQQDAADWFETSREDLCYVEAQALAVAASLTGGDFATTCEAEFEGCLENFTFDGEFTCEPESVPDSCEATVGDMEACVSDSAKIMSDLAKTKCKPIDAVEYALAVSELDTAPDSCAPLGDTCPFSVGF